MSAQIWAVTAGKGGVGKTFVSSSLGITLTKMNYSVVLVDFDCSSANLHTHLGLKPSSLNLKNYFSGESPLASLVQKTNAPRLSYIQGFWNSWSCSRINVDQVKKLVNEAQKLKFDYVVFDLGIGLDEIYLEVFKEADEKIIVSSPEPSSVEKTYRFVENFMFHKLHEISNQLSKEDLLSGLCNYRDHSHNGLYSLCDHLNQSLGISKDCFDVLNEKPVRLIINSSRGRLDQDLGHSIKSVVSKYYDLNLDYMGYLDFDNAVWQSVRSCTPVLLDKPFTPLAGEFLSMCKHLTSANFQSTFYKAVV